MAITTFTQLQQRLGTNFPVSRKADIGTTGVAPNVKGIVRNEQPIFYSQYQDTGFNNFAQAGATPPTGQGSLCRYGDGGYYRIDQRGTGELYLAKASIASKLSMSSSAQAAATQPIPGSGGIMFLYDRLYHNTFPVNVTTQQLYTGAVDFRRHQDAFEDLELWVECYTTLPATAITLTIGYENRDYFGHNTSIAIPAGMVAKTMYPVNLVGSYGVRQIKNVTVSAALATGSLGFTVLRRVAMLPFDGDGIVQTYDALDLGMPILSKSVEPADIDLPCLTSMLWFVNPILPASNTTTISNMLQLGIITG